MLAVLDLGLADELEQVQLDSMWTPGHLAPAELLRKSVQYAVVQLAFPEN